MRGGAVAELRGFLNVAGADFKLAVGWLLAAFRPDGPFPILSLSGEQGAAKSTAAKVLRSLIDPNKAPLRSAPRNDRDLWITASNGWVVCLNNLSFMSDWLSDALCQLAVDGGFATRKLYEDDEEMIFEGRRPIVLTGIEDLLRRGDLLDRSVVVTLPGIDKKSRRAEAEFWREFRKARPLILGALLDVISSGLKNLPGVKLDGLPRMGDFAKWVSACEPALGWKPGSFLRVYDRNIEKANELALGDSPVVAPLRRFLEDRRGQGGEGWRGTATELLDLLNRVADPVLSSGKTWPKSPNALSNRLTRLAPNLRKTGLLIDMGHDGTKRWIRLRIEKPESKQTSGSK